MVFLDAVSRNTRFPTKDWDSRNNMKILKSSTSVIPKLLTDNYKINAQFTDWLYFLFMTIQKKRKMKKNPSPRVCYPVGQVKREWACSWTLPDLWSLPFNLSSLALPLPKTSFPLPHRSRGNFLLLPIGKAYRYPAAFGWSDLGLIYIFSSFDFIFCSNRRVLFNFTTPLRIWLHLWWIAAGKWIKSGFFYQQFCVSSAFSYYSSGKFGLTKYAFLAFYVWNLNTCRVSLLRVKRSP